MKKSITGFKKQSDQFNKCLKNFKRASKELLKAYEGLEEYREICKMLDTEIPENEGFKELLKVISKM